MKATNETTPELMDYETARRLVERGWSVVPCNSNEEKRPLGRFSSAASWREFGERLPTDAELHEWFDPPAGPRVAGIVLHRGQLAVDRDTRDELPDGGAPWELSTKGSHEFFACDPAATKIGHDHGRRIDFLTVGSFVRCFSPRRLLEWKGDLPMYGGSRAIPTRPAATPPVTGGETVDARPGSIWSLLQAAGWKAGPERNGWVPITNGTKTAAVSANGENIKVFSTSIWDAPQMPEPVAPDVTPAAELAARHPEMPEAILPFCRRGSIALLSAAPKTGKTVLAVRTALKAASAGRRVMYADLENGGSLFAHRLRQHAKGGGGQGLPALPEGLWYLDCTERPDIDYIAAGVEAAGGVDLLIIDPWGLLIANSVEDESNNSLVSQYFLKVRRALKPFGCATLILHHLPKSGVDQPLNFAGAGASALQRYVQTIARIREDKNGNFWFEALCREFDEPFKPVLLRRSPPG